MFHRMLGRTVPVLLLVVAGCGQDETDGGGGSGSSSGSGGDPGWGGELPDGGSAGEGSEGAYETVTTVDPIAGNRIEGLDLTETHVYWITHGTTNLVTGLYERDGALHRQALRGGEVETVLEGLDAPTRLRVTSEEAFIWFDSLTHGSSFGRASLEGGEVEPLEYGDRLPAYIDVMEGRAYVLHDYWDAPEESGIFEYAAGQPPRRLVAITEYDLSFFAAGANYLYYTSSMGTQRVALEGSEPQLVTPVWMTYDVAEDDSQLVGVSTETQISSLSLHGTIPVDGRMWESVVELPEFEDWGGYSELRIAGKRWFVVRHDDDGTKNWDTLLMGLVGTSDWEEAPDILSEAESWDASETDLFRATETTLVRIPLE